MIYILNNDVKYDPLSATLYAPAHHPETLSLSRARNEILFLFVTNNQKLLTREFLMKKVWENQRLDSSNNNLNNHISMLRKALALCGCHDIIQTIAKQGLIFNAETVEMISQHTSEKQFSPIDPLLPALSSSVAGKEKWSSRIMNKKTLWFSLFLAFTLLLPSLYENLRLSILREEVFRTDQCRFYIVDDFTKSLSREKLLNRIKYFIKNKSLNCKDSKVNVYFFYDDRKNAIGQTLSTELVGYCPYKISAPCVNYQEYNINEKK